MPGRNDGSDTSGGPAAGDAGETASLRVRGIADESEGAAELGVPSSSHLELHPAVIVREGDTAGGESSSRPGVEGDLVRAG
eukprot:g14892.t1